MGFYKNKILSPDEQRQLGKEVLGYIESPSEIKSFIPNIAQLRLLEALGDPNKPVNGRSKRFIFQPDGGRWQVIFMNDKTYFYLDELVEGEPEWKDL